MHTFTVQIQDSVFKSFLVLFLREKKVIEIKQDKKFGT